VSLNIALPVVKLLKAAENRARSSSNLLRIMVATNLAAVLGVHEGKQLLVVGAPNGAPDSNGESCVDPLIADVVQQLGTNATHVPAGFVRTAELKVPAKHRKQVVSEEAVGAALEEEAKTVAVSEQLKIALAVSPNAVLVIIDEIAKTCITLAPLETVVAKISPTVTVVQRYIRALSRVVSEPLSETVHVLLNYRAGVSNVASNWSEGRAAGRVVTVGLLVGLLVLTVELLVLTVGLSCWSGYWS
jgi:hypothetical protein